MKLKKTLQWISDRIKIRPVLIRGVKKIKPYVSLKWKWQNEYNDFV